MKRNAYLFMFLSLVSLQVKAMDICWINAVADVPDGVVVYLNDADTKIIKLMNANSETSVKELVLKGKSYMVDSIHLPYGEEAIIIQIEDTCKVTSVNNTQGKGVMVEANSPSIIEDTPNTVTKFIPALKNWD
jgi:hypothetical protein